MKKLPPVDRVKGASICIVSAMRWYEDFLKSGENYIECRDQIKSSLTSAIMTMLPSPQIQFREVLKEKVEKAQNIVELDTAIRIIADNYIYLISIDMLNPPKPRD